MKVQLVINPNGCVHCNQIKETLAKLKPDYKDLEVKELSTTSNEGLKLVIKHGIMASPGLIIDGEFAFQGGVGENQLRKKLDEYKS